LQELDHGVDNNVNHTLFAEFCLEGKMQFSHLWETEDITVNATIKEEKDSGETHC
jgi:hypothetical protein